MEWYYSVNQEQRGPVTEVQLQDLVRQGVVGNASLVWKQGMSNWQPYGSMMGLGLPPGQGNCSSCGRVFPTTDMMPYHGMWICAECKPVFLQRLQEGLNPTGLMLWRSGKQLIMLKDAPMPERCVKCNGPAPGRGLKRNLTWHHPALYLLLVPWMFFFIPWLLYLIVAMAVQKRATVHIGLCERHRKRRLLALALGWGAVLFSVVMLIVSAGMDSPMVGIFGVLLLLAGLIGGAIGARTVHARRIKEKYVWLGGVCRGFLDTLPEWPGK